VAKATNEVKQVNESRADAALSPRFTPAAPPATVAGFIVIAASSPHKSCLQKLLGFFPVRIVKWEFSRTRKSWQLWLIAPQTPEVLELLGYTDLENGSLRFFKFCAENRVVVRGLWVLSLSKAPLKRALKLSAAIRSWLRDNFVPTLPLIVLVLVASILSGLTEIKQRPIEVCDVSPARWIAPAILAPSAPPALPIGAGAVGWVQGWSL
jgi:hypothetical protein